jgi:hypothetical protein
MRQRFALAVATMWAISYVVSTLANNYTGISLTTPVMLIAAAYLLHGNGVSK